MMTAPGYVIAELSPLMRWLDTWRVLAHHFHCIDFLVADGRLPKDFEPEHLAHLIERRPVTHTTHSACRFLLHVWNQKTHRFNLSDTIGWDRDHLAALAAWATGEATGQPGHYF